jgi:predicted outer membrane repeat protein
MKTTRAKYRGLNCVISAALALTLITPVASAGTIYVDDDAPAGGDGLTWNTAFRFLQDAIAFARQPINQVTEIRVAQGGYRPDQDELHPSGTHDVNAQFAAQGLSPILGGYAGVGTPDPNAREIDTYRSIVTGDLLGDDNAGFEHFQDNSASLFPGEVQLDGLYLQGAVLAAGSQFDVVSVNHCRFTGNKRAVVAESGYINSCIFDSNVGGASISYPGFGDIHDCTFIRQKGLALFCGEANIAVADTSFNGNLGGAALISAGGTGWFERCTFSNNTATLGGAIAMTALGSDNVTLNAVNCEFIGNTAQKGGAVYGLGDSSGATVGASFKSCLFDQNSANIAGGVICIIRGYSTFTNCTIVRNSAPVGPAIYNASSSNLRVFNSIAKFNSGSPFAGPGFRTVRLSDISGGHYGTGNINANPQFVDLANGDFHLQANSPCIDAGRKSFAIGLHFDLDGNPRFIDIPTVPNTGSGNPAVDMGCYEFQGK